MCVLLVGCLCVRMCCFDQPGCGAKIGERKKKKLAHDPNFFFLKTLDYRSRSTLVFFKEKHFSFSLQLYQQTFCDLKSYFSSLYDNLTTSNLFNGF